MDFNPGNGTGVVDEINDICNSDNNSYPLLSKARRVNGALDRFFTLAHQAAKPGTVDDINRTTAPIEEIAITSGTGRYGLDTFASELGDLIRFEVTDASGTRTLLRHKNLESIEGALASYQSTSGTPQEYLLVGKYIELKPAPNFTGTLTAYFNRNKVAFTAASGAVSLGIPSKFHPYICRLAALPHLIEFQKGQKNDVAEQIRVDEEAILIHFSTRERGTRRGAKAAPQDNR